MREQFQIFLTAVMFFTRLPVSRWVVHSQDRLDHASRYFPLVGWIVGGWAVLFFWTSAMIWPVPVAVLISILATILLTGAFHEDGLADVCDGVGGGWTQEQILAIMKDSRLGTYGAAGLALALLLKWQSLSAITVEQLPAVMLCGHALSRFAPLILIRFGHYAREDLQAKAKPLATRMGNGDLITGFICAVLPLLLLPWLVWWTLPVAVTIGVLLLYYFQRWVGGYTGDCLGSVQQISEIFIYLTLLAVL